MKTIYHIATRADWDSAQESGEYRVESLETQGFIHMSQSVDQVLKVANAIYTGQSDLVLLHIDEQKVTPELKYEAPDSNVPAHHYKGELFPHLYGALNVPAVVNVTDFTANPDGKFTQI